MPYALREAFASFRRTPLLMVMSIIAVSLSLFVVGLFGVTAFNVRRTLAEIEDRVEVVAYLRDGTTLEQVRVAEAEILSLPEVMELRYVSKTEALATAVDELPEFTSLFAGLDVNPLPASLEIRLRPGYRTPTSVESLAQQVTAYPFVEEANYGREWVAKIVSLQRIAAGATVMIGTAFGAVAGIIIATAVRIAVAARREEIEIMRLVGATDSFIRMPFLLEGLMTGTMGGLLAVLLTYLAHRSVNAALIPIEWVPMGWLVVTVALGGAYGLIASAIALRRHLRNV
jgi:cell division transport system permease protein